jgi:hypothetical protein
VGKTCSEYSSSLAIMAYPKENVQTQVPLASSSASAQTSRQNATPTKPILIAQQSEALKQNSQQIN